MLVKNKTRPKMFEPPVAIIAKLLLPPMLFWAWITNLDNIKSTIIFIFTLIYGMIQAYFWVKRAIHNKRMRELDLEERERKKWLDRTIEEEEKDEYG